MNTEIKIPIVSTESEDFPRNVPDARLIEEVRQGDQDSFGEIVQRYERRVMRVVMRFIDDYELARDLTQEVFIRAFERLDQFEQSRRFGPCRKVLRFRRCSVAGLVSSI